MFSRELTEEEKNNVKENIEYLTEDISSLIISTENGVGVVGNTPGILALLSLTISRLIELGFDEKEIDKSVKIGKFSGNHSSEELMEFLKEHEENDDIDEDLKDYITKIIDDNE